MVFCSKQQSRKPLFLTVYFTLKYIVSCLCIIHIYHIFIYITFKYIDLGFMNPVDYKHTY